jgi:hypothetical protein
VLKADRYLDRVLFPTDPGDFDHAKGIHSAPRFLFHNRRTRAQKVGTHQRIV